MTIVFQKVDSTLQILAVENLAQEIWTQHYTPFLAAGQVPYMLEKFQSAGAITKQISEGHQYFLISPDSFQNSVRSPESENPFGYFDFYQKEDLVFISKIYVKQQFRGRGFGAAALAFISERAKEIDVKKLQLTVNKYNQGAIKAYEKTGFINVKSIVMDIGNGFFMDDYVFEKAL